MKSTSMNDPLIQVIPAIFIAAPNKPGNGLILSPLSFSSGSPENPAKLRVQFT
ncbi:MAG: hypothetical protein GY744_15805 [Gammaproteobacteria bacterium]|nr:hypothetical protein [Gammaproteobacteria bacterium]